MSEQNQMAISPIGAGLAGAAIGGVGNYFLGVGAKPKEGYRDVKELLTTLPKDQFEALKKDINENGSEEAKAEFKKLEDGRTTVSAAGDTLVTEQATARKEINTTLESELNTALTDPTKKAAYDSAVQETKTAYTTAQGQLTDAKKTLTDAIADTADGKVGDLKGKAKAELVAALSDDKIDAFKADTNPKRSQTLKDLIAKLATETDATKKAELEKQIKAQTKKEIIADLRKDTNSALRKYQDALKGITTDTFKSNVKAKAEAVNTARDAYHTKALDAAGTACEGATDGTPLKALQTKVSKWKEVLGKKAEDLRKAKADELVGENGTLKDLDISKFKKFLPKAKMWPAIIAAAIFGAVGVGTAYAVGPKNETPADVA